MGCDIHVYLELVEEISVDKEYIYSVAEFYPGRNYWLFSLMAGVRNDSNPNLLLFPPKGLPKEVGYIARYENELFVPENYTGEERTTSRENADKWIAAGKSKQGYHGEKWVTNPDWHSHSWLTTKEMEVVKERYERYMLDTNILEPFPPKYESLLRAMHGLG